MQISLFKYEIHVEISLFKSADIFISNRDIYFHWNTDISYSKYRHLYFKYRYLYFKYIHLHFLSSSVFVPTIVANNFFHCCFIYEENISNVSDKAAVRKRFSLRSFRISHWEIYARNPSAAYRWPSVFSEIFSQVPPALYVMGSAQYKLNQIKEALKPE